MQKVLATFRNGCVELAIPVDWPDGTAVEVVPIEQRIGMSEADWPATTEGIQTLLRHMDEATSGDDEPVEFAWDWPAWDERQEEASRSSWNQLEKLF